MSRRDPPWVRFSGRRAERRSCAAFVERGPCLYDEALLMVIDSIASDPLIERLIAGIAAGKGVVHASGAWGSSAPMLAALVAASHPRTHLYVTAHLDEADNARDDLELFWGSPCELFPAWETLPGEGPACGEVEAERLRQCVQLARRRAEARPEDSERRGLASRISQAQRLTSDERGRSTIIVAPIQALMQPVPSHDILRRNTLNLAVGRKQAAVASPEAVVAWAVDRGFARLDLVESPGDVARRGDIVDLFVPGETQPYRVQFCGETVESIRRIDVSTQRSIETLPYISISAMPDGDWTSGSDTTHLCDCLPADTLVVLDEPGEIQEMGLLLESRLGVSKRLFEINEVLSRYAGFAQLHLSRFPPASASGEAVFHFAVSSLTRFESSAPEAVAELCRVARDHEVHVICDNEGERQRLAEMANEQSPDAAGRIRMSLGVMHRGFEWTRTGTVVIGHHELFQRHRQRRRMRRLHAGRPLDSWTDLQPGEPVVHVVHGIAIYRGLSKMRKGVSNQQEEFLTLEFADKAVIHVPSSQVDLVQKYIGMAGRRPQLSTLGGKRWSKAKQQVADAVADLAQSLLRVQAIRAEAKGTAYPADTEWQREFDASFIYEETEDQLAVGAQIRDDLTGPRPMDRLVCGDVGYGKTELAMRATFKVVEYGRQVAVLVPTTVLAEQHFETFSERMAEYPFLIGCLSRFRSPSQQRKLVGQIKKGQVDVVIGTHRLLSQDVSFANLGLVIIDEEQRFGVEHKERLKAMRETVDVLTLTATPIPRTLHMALMGVKDISSLQTPPVDRRAIATQVRTFERSFIRDAVLREMNRDGQVYFIHNYVQSIAAIADTVRSIVPEARVVYAHGQMKDDQLEAVMHRFLRREADVLVCTTIIENGIDIPSVNTIFINRADRFGLADLHQLRGRVGRSSHRAYCYLLLSPHHPPTAKAAKRLKTIEEFSELGAGFRIAMRDLEIRGAGNLIGREQSGHIAAVGYEMYCRLLEQTVRRLKNEPDRALRPVHLDLDVAAHIPRHYIGSERTRIDMYRRIVDCREAGDIAQLQRDLLDVFGPFPGQVQRLIELAEIRILARTFGIVSISRRPPDVIFGVDNAPLAERLFSEAPGTVRVPDGKTVHLRPPPEDLEPAKLVPLLKRMLTQAGAKMGATA